MLIDHDLFEELCDALKPFAEMADLPTNAYEASGGDEVVLTAGTIGRYWAVITVEDLRRASRALAKARGETDINGRG